MEQPAVKVNTLVRSVRRSDQYAGNGRADGDSVATFKANINRFLLDPPMWVRILGPISIVLLVLGMASKRGWLVSIIAAIV